LRRAVAVDLADACVYKLKLNGGDGGEKKAFQKGFRKKKLERKVLKAASV